MLKIICKQARGFQTTDKAIRVFDKNRKPFYVFDAKKDVTRFNLPKGVFYTDNKIIPLKCPVKYRLTLPPFEREIKRPKKIVVTWGDNPNKATIVLQAGKILIDNSFKNYPSFVPVYVIFHEIGHYRYKSELGADAFARVQMLKRGYNPSQIGMASRLTLSPKSAARIVACFDALKKSHL